MKMRVRKLRFHRRPAPVEITRARLMRLRRGQHLHIDGTRYLVTDHLLYSVAGAGHNPVVHRFSLSSTDHSTHTLYLDSAHDMAWLELASVDPVTEVGDTLTVSGSEFCVQDRTERIVSTHDALASFRRVSLVCYRLVGATAPGQYLLVWLEKDARPLWIGILTIEVPLTDIRV